MFIPATLFARIYEEIFKCFPTLKIWGERHEMHKITITRIEVYKKDSAGSCSSSVIFKVKLTRE